MSATVTRSNMHIPITKMLRERLLCVKIMLTFQITLDSAHQQVAQIKPECHGGGGLAAIAISQ